MSLVIKPYGLFLFLFTFIVACSNAPDQPQTFAEGPGATVIGSGDKGKNNVDYVIDYQEGQDEVGGWLGEEGDADIDQIVKENSEKPIIYGVGAGGVTLDTTFAESKKMLTKPVFGPNQDGEAQYNERLYVRWRTEGEKRTPFFILALPGYKGKIQITKPSGGITRDLALSDDFSSYMGSNPREGADQLAIDMYRAFTGSDQNCVKDNICTINWGDQFQNFYLIQFPGLIVRLSKDRFVLFIGLVQKTIPQGPLANDFDIFTSSFVIDGEEPIQLGQSFEEVDSRMVAADASLDELEISVNLDNFGRGYEGIFLIYEKTDYSRESIRPKKTDRLMGVSLYDQYRNNFLVDGLPVYVHESDNSVTISEMPKSDLTGTQTKTLQTKMNLKPGNIKSFSEQLVAFLKKKAMHKYPVVSGRLIGQHQIKSVKEYDGQIVGYDPATKKGVYIGFTTSEETGNINDIVSIIIREDLSAYDALVVPLSADNQAVQKVSINNWVDKSGHSIMSSSKLPYYSELSGVRLNDLLKVSDKDILARNEATIEFVQPFSVNDFLPAVVKENIGLKERASYSNQGEIYLPAVNNSLMPRNQHFASVSNFGVNLGVIPVAEMGDETLVRVVSITSSFINGQLKDLCNLKTFTPNFGMKDTVFQEALASALKSEGKKCNYFATFDDGSNNRVTSIYFPDDRLRLSFGDRELLQAMIYLPENEIMPVATGGAQ